jgi:hypothetical protein
MSAPLWSFSQLPVLKVDIPHSCAQRDDIMLCLAWQSLQGHLGRLGVAYIAMVCAAIRTEMPFVAFAFFWGGGGTNTERHLW